MGGGAYQPVGSGTDPGSADPRVLPLHAWSRRSAIQSSCSSTTHLTSVQEHGLGCPSSSHATRAPSADHVLPPSYSPCQVFVCPVQKSENTGHCTCPVFSGFFFTRQSPKKTECPVENRTPGNPKTIGYAWAHMAYPVHTPVVLQHLQVLNPAFPFTQMSQPLGSPSRALWPH